MSRKFESSDKAESVLRQVYEDASSILKEPGSNEWRRECGGILLILQKYSELIDRWKEAFMRWDLIHVSAIRIYSSKTKYHPISLSNENKWNQFGWKLSMKYSLTSHWLRLSRKKRIYSLGTPEMLIFIPENKFIRKDLSLKMRVLNRMSNYQSLTIIGHYRRKNIFEDNHWSVWKFPS